MEFSSDLSWLGVSLQIFFVDLLLGGDNAIIIAAACTLLPRRLVPRAIAVGAVGAIVMRVLMALMANMLMNVPLLKALGGCLLALFAINLRANARATGESSRTDALYAESYLDGDGDFMGAAVFILLADTIMSLDNVVAISAVSQGNLTYMILGLTASVPFVFLGSFLLREAIAEYPAFVTIGAGLLGWVAGDLIVTDPIWAGWIRANVEALGVLLPLFMAAFVIGEGMITEKARAPSLAGLAKIPPPRAIKAKPAGVKPSIESERLKSPPVDKAGAGVVLAREERSAPSAPKPMIVIEPPVSSSAGPSDKAVLIGLLVLAALVGLLLAIAIAMGQSH